MWCIGRGICALLILVTMAASPAHAQRKRVTKPAPRKPAAVVRPRTGTDRPAWIKDLSPGMLRDYSENQPPVIMDTPAGRADDEDNGGKESPKEGPNGKPIRKPTRLPAKQTFRGPALRSTDALSVV